MIGPDSIDALFSSGTLPAPAEPRPRRESSIQEQVLDYINSVPGVFAMKAGAAAFRATYRDKRTGAMRERFVKIGRAGTSDIIGWVSVVRDPNGAPMTASLPRFLAIEVKRPGQKPDERQQRFLDRVRAANGIAGVVRSLADVKALLR